MSPHRQWARKSGVKGDAPVREEWNMPGMPWSLKAQQEVWTPHRRFVRHRERDHVATTTVMFDSPEGPVPWTSKGQREVWSQITSWRKRSQASLLTVLRGESCDSRGSQTVCDSLLEPVAAPPLVGHGGAAGDHNSQHMRRHVRHMQWILGAERCSPLPSRAAEPEEDEPDRAHWRILPGTEHSSQRGSPSSPHVMLQTKRVHSILSRDEKRTGSLSDASTATSDDGDGQDSWTRQEVVASQEFKRNLVGTVPSSRVESAILGIVFAALPEGLKDDFPDDCFSLCAPSIEQRARVNRCLSELRGVLRTSIGRSWRALPFGSHVNGLALPGSDLDVTCIRAAECTATDTEYSAAYALHAVLRPLLQRHPSFRVTEQVLKARVPILKLCFEQQLDVDFSWNNSKPLQNTRLLQTYVGLGASVRDFIIAVKLWAHAAEVCGASQAKLSTYSFTLMAIYFLQVDPEVRLPCLPAPTAEDLISEEAELYAIPSEFDTSWSCSLPLPVLLARFFRFYGEQFAWGLEVVSVRVGRRLQATSEEYAFLPYRDQHRIHIEDPCEQKRNLHCVLGADEEFGLRQAFAEAVQIIWKIRLPFYFQSVETRPAEPGINRLVAGTDEIQESSSRASREARADGPLRRRWPTLKPLAAQFHESAEDQESESLAPANAANAQKNKHDDAHYWFALLASAYLYTLYASFSGNLFRLALAVCSLCLVLVEKRKRTKRLDSGKASQGKLDEEPIKQSHSRSLTTARLGKNRAKHWANIEIRRSDIVNFLGSMRGMWK